MHAPNIHSSTVYNNQDMEATKCPSRDKWIKIWYNYTVEYYSAIKKKERMPFSATCMDLEIIVLSEVRQRKTNHVISHVES